MPVTAYNLYEFNQGLIGLGYDQQTRAQVENYLISHGYSADTSPTAPTDIIVPTNVMITGGRTFTVNTSTNPSLSYILDPGATTMTLTGSTSVGISLADGDIKLIMEDSGNDTVYTGSGSDTIDGHLSSGNDTLYASGSGHATITGGFGADSIIALDDQGPTGVGPGGGGGELISGSHAGGPGSSARRYGRCWHLHPSRWCRRRHALCQQCSRRHAYRWWYRYWRGRQRQRDVGLHGQQSAGSGRQPRQRRVQLDAGRCRQRYA